MKLAKKDDDDQCESSKRELTLWGRTWFLLSERTECQVLAFGIFLVDLNFIIIFLAVQNSSIGDLVTQSLTHSLTH